MGPDTEAAVWPRLSVATSLPLAALAAVNPESAAVVVEGRQSSRRLAWSFSPPVFVTMFTALPVLPPYSAENAFSRMVICCTASIGILLKMVWRPQLSFPVLPSTSNHACLRPAPFDVKRFSFMKTSP